MKKIAIIGVIALSMLSLTACSSNKETATTKPSTTKSSKKNIKLEVPSTIETDKDGNVYINGKTEPNTRVQIKYGLSTSSVVSDSDGNFESRNYILIQGDEINASATVFSTSGEKITKEIVVKRSAENKEKLNNDKIKQQKEEEAKKQAEEQAEADKKNPATYPELPYDEMARNGNKHKGEKLKITGTVRQVMDRDTGGAILRVATSENGYDDMYLVQIDSTEWENHRLLEDDVISFYGEVYGLYSYESTMGGKITVPDLIVNMY
ncbi:MULTISPECIES: hypothetical protein [Lactococcus]|uniref:hypothetical protein n=1 Tax=Lactococcus TaxID=1357 RepID=UPI00038B1CA5|nr:MULTISPECIES: hypothetical protein [Lactococcus]EQC55384.1 hypothetical protein LLT5_01080 [Lactococcus cremoris subsp. cremoris TIFN5]EQC55391.1 hypothetical protein LLT5_13550 [Lactococcus cremoris subsp. cremoris TIFN5]EQC88996.1 hypothetical protein LLT1_00945 [Lactococcus cremoris subsp. cremoris TIFN1]EQC89004.1 hypothetical protein LLT1_13770 [Lactococcus cremoris subsp. cremoris TIFN1]